MRKRPLFVPSWPALRTRRLATAVLPLALLGAVGFASVGPAEPAGATSPGWTLQASYPAPPTPDAVSCASGSVCIAVGGDFLVTTDAGTAWTSQALPAGVKSLDAVSCP